MAAAAAGKSRLGIPQEVGAEFLKADRGKRFLKRKKKPTRHLRRK
jgi:hypothetical protein